MCAVADVALLFSFTKPDKIVSGSKPLFQFIPPELEKKKKSTKKYIVFYTNVTSVS